MNAYINSIIRQRLAQYPNVRSNNAGIAPAGMTISNTGDTFEMSGGKSTPEVKNSLWDRVELFFSKKKRLEYKKNEITRFAQEEMERRGFDKNLLKLGVNDLGSNPKIATAAELNLNTGKVTIVPKILDKIKPVMTKGIVVHELTHLYQHSLIASLPEKDLNAYNKAQIQNSLVDIDDETKNVIKQTNIEGINGKFVDDYCAQHPGMYPVGSEEDKQYIINEFKGFKMLLENPDIEPEKLPLSINIDYYKSLRNNKPLTPDEYNEAVALAKSMETYASERNEIDGSNKSKKAKKQDYNKVYYNDLMEQEAYDKEIEFMSEQNPKSRKAIDKIKYLKEKNPKKYYEKSIIYSLLPPWVLNDGFLFIFVR